MSEDDAARMAARDGRKSLSAIRSIFFPESHVFLFARTAARVNKPVPPEIASRSVEARI
jgi:hypothetical protein